MVCGASLILSPPPISILNTTSAWGRHRGMDAIAAQEGVVIQALSRSWRLFTLLLTLLQNPFLRRLVGT